MSVVAYYARIGGDEFEALSSDPERFWDLPEMPWDLNASVDPAAAEQLYLDKTWKVLSWLCSAVGRSEQRNETASFNVLYRDEVPADRSIEEFRAAIAKEASALGFEYVEPDKLPADPVLSAIQGLREGEEGTRIDLGLAARIFAPTQVAELASALAALSEASIRSKFDLAEMELHDFGGDGDASELDEFYLPALRRLRALYERAANARQHIVVVIS